MNKTLGAIMLVTSLVALAVGIWAITIILTHDGAATFVGDNPGNVDTKKEETGTPVLTGPQLNAEVLTTVRKSKVIMVSKDDTSQMAAIMEVLPFFYNIEGAKVLSGLVITNVVDISDEALATINSIEKKLARRSFSSESERYAYMRLQGELYFDTCALATTNKNIIVRTKKDIEKQKIIVPNLNETDSITKAIIWDDKPGQVINTKNVKLNISQKDVSSFTNEFFKVFFSAPLVCR